MKMRLRTSFSLFCFLFLTFNILLPTAAAAQTKDACSLVTPADAEAALGEPAGPAKTASRPSRPGAESSACRFRSTQGSAMSGKSLTLTLHYSDSDVKDSKSGIMDNLKAGGFKNVHEVSGLGDGAVWGTTSMMNRPMGQLTVLKGKCLFTIDIGGVQDEATALDHAKALAAKIVPKV